MNPKTQESRDWRAEQRRLGFVPKLIWVRESDWPRVKALNDKLKAKKARSEAFKASNFTKGSS